ncbi:LPS export ABC transporter periplasmic protein LptC [Biformimicrobium ophioploci]|uniref:Lipopolysaccharide export system protein LptC n=1 Tax=Biformimicrobium ophioploci TaxID=3036711 RepID=A0ABQ6LX56_9GAMM|nr:LPS export ABC transporter periplasmic protein LptC [Microbulbifer sp. NKW57]GMG86602.1 hypothetical protein MNKW57_09230 [Microbulbifer sp. NKW57]
MRTWIPLAVALLVALGLWIADSPPDQLGGKRPSRKQQNQAADLVIRGAQTSHFDKNGLLAYQFNSDKLTYFQYTRRDRADLVNPEIIFFEESEPRWQVTARTGRATNNGSNVVFRGNVVIERSGAGAESKLSTSELQMKPHDKYAHTNKTVTISNLGSQITGKGMKADLNKNHLELLSEVESTYETRQGTPE